jgi:tetratricopeptide (TPR) repeat protein
MPSPPASGRWNNDRRGGKAAVWILALGLLAGCATVPYERGGDARHALRSIPQVPDGHLRADRALVAAFFAANGIEISAAEANRILPDSATQGWMDRNALRNIATKHNRLLMVVKADERFLWDELGNNLPLLVLLPPDTRYRPGTTPMIPVAWDRKKGAVDLLDGNGEIQTLPETDFFARRDPLKQAALCLIRPGALGHFEPTREQKLLLADFWFDKGFYRRANAAYAAIQKEAPASADALVGQGNALVRSGRYEDSISCFRAALALEPDNPKILNNLAYSMLHGDGELLVALRHAHKAAQLDPDNPLVLETLGSINLAIGDAVAAAKYLEQAWARSTKHSPEVQIAIMDQLVRAWHAADRNDLAWQVAEFRQRTFPQYKFPNDILFLFSDLRKTPVPSGK